MVVLVKFVLGLSKVGFGLRKSIKFQTEIGNFCSFKPKIGETEAENRHFFNNRKPGFQTGLKNRLWTIYPFFFAGNRKNVIRIRFRDIRDTRDDILSLIDPKYPQP
jgi:hypothetical protein